MAVPHSASLAAFIAGSRRRDCEVVVAGPEPSHRVVPELSGNNGWHSTLTWTALYLCFTELGRLLYVGVTSEPDRRLTDHLRSAPFARDVALIVERWMPLRSLALTAETQVIETYRPPFNLEPRVERTLRRRARLHCPAGVGPHPVDVEYEGQLPLVAHASAHRCWRCATPRQLRAVLEGGGRCFVAFATRCPARPPLLPLPPP